MSVKCMGAVWDLDLPRNEKFVLLAYTDHADHDGTNIYPSVGLISRKTGYDKRSVQRITRDLVNRGLLISDGSGPRGTNKYYFPIDVLDEYPEYVGGVKMSPPTDRGDTGVIPPLTLVSSPPDVDVTPPLTPVSPDSSLEPSLKPSIEPSGDPPSKEQNTWLAALTQILNEQYGTNRYTSMAANFRKYWQPTEAESYRHNANGSKVKILCVGDDPEYQRDWLTDRGKTLAERVLVGILGENVEVEFVIRESDQTDDD